MPDDHDRSEDSDSLTGKFLIAMPSMEDPRFQRSVIYMCAHGPDGAMGLVVNKRADSVNFSELIIQLDLDPTRIHSELPIHFGGPVERGRGFVLHSTDFVRDGTMQISETIGLTATLDILREIVEGRGPRHSLFALGYAGWAAGQLDSEIQANGWLHVDADPRILFDCSLDERWERSLALIGIDPSMLSSTAGHA